MWRGAVFLLAGAALSLANLAAIAVHEAAHCFGSNGSCDVRFHMDNLATAYHNGGGFGEPVAYSLQVLVGGAFVYGIHRLWKWRPV